MGLGGASGGKVRVPLYYLGQHLGFCSALDWVSKILYREKLLWSGKADANATVTANNPDLFGGDAKEGGVEGKIEIMLGGPEQVPSAHLATRLGRTVDTCPGFRGITSLYFRHISDTETRAGFRWQTSNAYLGNVWMEGTRAPKGILPDIALIPRGGGGIAEEAAIFLRWQQSTFDQGTNDRARMGLRFLDSDGDEISSTFASMTATAAGEWTERTLSVNAPVGTAVVRIVMEMTRQTGTNNDGYIDDIFFQVDGQTIALTNPGAESGSMAGWTGTAQATDGSDFVDPELHPPFLGDWFFWGGTNASATSYQDYAIGPGPDANPAHIIYECLTDSVFGMGAPSTLIDVASFEDCAQTLYDEGLGLSLTWSRQTEIENFVREIIDHIEATLFINPRTGLFTLKLIRGDYDEEDLRELDPDNCVVKKWERKAWGDTINEVVVTWTNPETEEEEAAPPCHDLANIAMQGAIVSTSRNYYGVRSETLARQLGFRDLRVAAEPLASCDVEVDRTFWDLLPGDVVKLTWPEYGIDTLIMRVGPVDYGKPGDAKVKASLVEDIFAKPSNDFTPPNYSEWEDPDEFAEPIDLVRIFTLPYFFTEQTFGVDIDGIEYPEVAMGVLAADESSTNGYDLMIEGLDTLGDPVYNNVGTKNLVGHGALVDPLDAEAESLVPAFADVIGEPPAAGGFLFIGDAAEDEMEICLIDAYDEVNYTLRRGVLDTVPRAWPADTPVWFVLAEAEITEDTVLTAGQTVNIKLLTSTSLGQLPEADAPVETETLTERPHLPTRPGDVKVNSVGFGDVDAIGVDPIPVTWANRNRLTEPTPFIAWDDATVTAEDGQTTTVIVKDLGGATLTTHDSLPGTSFDLPLASFAGEEVGLVSVWAERDDLLSLQAHQLVVQVVDVLELEDTGMLELESSGVLALE
jgi:hypothetical protein